MPCYPYASVSPELLSYQTLQRGIMWLCSQLAVLPHEFSAEDYHPSSVPTLLQFPGDLESLRHTRGTCSIWVSAGKGVSD